jgi:hypothetical protein
MISLGATNKKVAMIIGLIIIYTDLSSTPQKSKFVSTFNPLNSSWATRKTCISESDIADSKSTSFSWWFLFDT